MLKYNYQEAQHDAGLLREYIVLHYGYVLAEGGMSAVYNRGMRQINRLARMTGFSRAQVLEDIQSDYWSLPD